MDTLHHRWEDLETDRPMEKIVRRRLIGEKAMLSHVSLEAGCEVATHSHENEQWAILLEGRLQFGLGEPEGSEFRTVVVKAGEVLHLPSGLPHTATALEDTVVIDVFSPPSEMTGIDAPSR
jgi:quercetin dioxygenase-like cupin family protein